MAEKRNIAATLGWWSARHRKTAIFGWLLFVVLVTVLGNAWGQSGLPDYQQLAGGSAQAEKIVHQAGIGDPAVELVLIHSTRPSVTTATPAFHKAVAAVLDQVSSTRLVRDVAGPYSDQLLSRDGHDALVRFDMKNGDDSKVGTVLAAVASAAGEQPGLFNARNRGCERPTGPQRHPRRQFHTGGVDCTTGRPGHLAHSFRRSRGSVAPCCAGLHGLRRRTWARRPAEPCRCARRLRQLGDAADWLGCRR